MAETQTRTVGDIMSYPVTTARGEETIALCAERMRDQRVGSVVVIAESDAVVGILTERDIVRFGAAGADASSALVSEWMTKNPDTIDKEVSVSDAFESLAEHGYRHIPVVSDNKLVGLVSMRDLMRVAQIQPSGALAHEVPKGLEGVVVAETTIGHVRGMEGFYHYREYNAVELAEKRPLEDIWRLMFEGALPTTVAERKEFMDEVEPLRYIPDEIMPVLPHVAKLGANAGPLELLRTTVSLYATALGFGPSMDVSAEELRTQALRVCSVTPTLLMAMYRLRNGKEPVAPRADLSYAANYLYMMNGKEPDPIHAWAVEKYLISTIDHGFNASTFTGRVVTSTGADLGSAVVAAIGALSGPLHGGAPSRALQMIEEIGTIDNAEPWLRNAVESGSRLMGFGHRVYKTDDPRSLMLRGVAEKLGGELVDFAKQIEEVAVRVLNELKPGRKLYTNVEFYAGVVMHTCGLPPEMFTPTFASSRMIGWTSHVLEQAADNRLIRPSAHYRGPRPPQPVPEIR